MKFAIDTSRDLHRVQNESQLRAKHAAFIAKQVASGLRSIQIHQSDAPQIARVNHGAWVFDCDCGAGVGADPEFTASYCHGCGAIHTNVVFPENRAEIEACMLARPKTANRNWDPEESIDDALHDNHRHGFGERPGEAPAAVLESKALASELVEPGADLAEPGPVPPPTTRPQPRISADLAASRRRRGGR